MGLGDYFIILKVTNKNVKLYTSFLKYFQHNMAFLQMKEDIVSNKDIPIELYVTYIDKLSGTH